MLVGQQHASAWLLLHAASGVVAEGSSSPTSTQATSCIAAALHLSCSPESNKHRAWGAEKSLHVCAPSKCASCPAAVAVAVASGRFVPNITIGPLVVDALRPVTDKVLDCHLVSGVGSAGVGVGGWVGGCVGVVV